MTAPRPNLLQFGPVDSVTEPASHANAVELFAPTWVSRLPVNGMKSGSMGLFTEADPRPQYVVDIFNDIKGWKILELGSFEGGHTYQLEKLGAGSILGIEANPYIFLRSLVAKNILGLKAQFLLGDFLKFLEKSEDQYDLIFCSGVIYHMTDPIELLFQISKCSNRVFVWSHYVSEEIAKRWHKKKVSDYANHGVACTYYKYDYPDRPSREYGGKETYSARITKDAMHTALRHFGFDHITILKDDISHPGGPALSLMAWKEV